MSVTTYILDDDGRPVECRDHGRWAMFISDFWNRVVASDHVGRCEVTTIFTGLDLAPRPGAKPALWETTVQLGSSQLEALRRAYRSQQEALTGHAEVVRAVVDQCSERGVAAR